MAENTLNLTPYGVGAGYWQVKPENGELVVQIVNNKPVVSSRQIAEKFEKEHFNVMRDIENIIGGVLKIEDTPDQMFFKTTYIHEQNGQKYPMYLMNRDGFSLLVMGFTGEKALDWKLKFIKAFNAMEAKLKLIEQQELGRIIERQRSKEIRRTLTDVIRDCVPESPHKKFMYKNFTDLVYKSIYGKNCKQLKTELGLSKDDNLRDVFSKEELEVIETKEDLVRTLVKSGYSYNEIKLILAKSYITG